VASEPLVPHQLDIIWTLTGALTAALVFGLVAHRLSLSPIVGYLIAGVVVGPHTPGFVAHPEIASQFGELGVILLMFGVGLNLHVDELLRVKRVALPGALLNMAAATLGGWLVTRVLGWSTTSGVIYGLTIAVASTVVMLRVFAEHRVLDSEAGKIAVGWLLVEDLFVVFVVIILPTLAPSGVAGAAMDAAALGKSVLLALAKIGGLVLAMAVVGRWFIPRLLGAIERTASRELFTLAILVVAIGVAVCASKLFGASMALGAFLAGLVVGQTTFGSRAALRAFPFRDAFAVLFFVATGMLLDPKRLGANLPLTLLTLVVLWVVKPVVAIATVRALGYSMRTAAPIGAGLGQIGEFSFMLSALALRLGMLPESATPALVTAAIASIAVNPLLLRAMSTTSRGGVAPPSSAPPAVR
jgi:CPA2 family monovalent cation:H+ antiporter-2